METTVNLLLILKKKQGSEYIRMTSLLKKHFGKHFKVFQNFAGTADTVTTLFGL